MSVAVLRRELLDLYDEFPFEFHPLWKAVIGKSLSLQQVLLAEGQHYLRTKAGRALRQRAMVESKGSSPELFQALLRTYLEECTSDDSGPSHLELIERLLLGGGMKEGDLPKIEATPGNIAAMALYRDIATRGAGCHLVGAGVVEYYYAKLSPRIFAAYTNLYGMPPEQAETYRIHGPMDAEHAERALAVLDAAVGLHGTTVIKQGVRDAFIATSLHYDGMLQAATRLNQYWDGKP